MMLSIVRRRVSHGGSSSSILGQSFCAIRTAASTPGIYSTPGGEILHHPGGFGHVRNLCHLILPGRTTSLRPIREACTSLRLEATMQIQHRLFSSDNGMSVALSHLKI